MNEYARLARLKPIEARSYTELVAACYGLDEKRAEEIAQRIQDAPAVKAAIMQLPTRRAATFDLYDLCEEIKHRKDPAGLVKEGLTVVSSQNDVVSQCAELRTKKKEHLLAFFLNARNQMICKEIISIGTLTASLAHPREIFSPAIGKAAASVILAHNHPSGDPSPSDEDIRLTKRIVQAGHILGIDLLDHIIIAENGCYSFKSAGQLP